MSLAGKLYRALHAFGPTDDPEDLTFKAGEVIVVTDKDAGEGWWEGELNGRSGTFPASYVQSISDTKKSFTAPEDTDPVASEAASQITSDSSQMEQSIATASAPRRSSFASSENRKKKSLSWSLDKNSEDYTFAKQEYDRSMDGLDHMSMAKNHQQWEMEEEDERVRQLMVAFETWEKELPPGTKCPQRLEYEAELAKKEAAKKAAEAEQEEKRRRFREAREAKRRAQVAEQAKSEAASKVTPDVAADVPSQIESENTRSVELTAEHQSDERNSAKNHQDTPFTKLSAALHTTISKLKGSEERGIEGFSLEFRNLDMEDRQRFSLELCQAGTSHPECNRYRDILPYDKHRVPLNRGNGYINASFVKDLLPGSPVYIAAQGPKPETVGHFWKMIAEHRCTVIAMLTRCIESNRRKCEEYWPAPDSSLFFDADDGGPAVGVVSNSEIRRELWVERRFTVVSEHSSHEVVHLHFTRWPDHGVPENPSDAIKFIQEAMRLEKAAEASRRAPIAVHCSAGVGRTGVFAVLHSIMTRLPAYAASKPIEPFDIIAMVRHLRQSRRYMVQTIEQFRFCFEAAAQVLDEFIKAIGTVGAAALHSSPSGSVSSNSGTIKILHRQLKQSLRREYDANRARAELQKDLLEMTTGIRDEAVVADLREDVALAQQRLLQMTKRNHTQAVELGEMRSKIEERELQVKQMAAIVGQLEMDMADKDDEIDALKEQLAKATGTAVESSTISDTDYINIEGTDDDAAYIVMEPSATDSADITNDVGSASKPTFLIGDAVNDDSDSEL